VQNSLVHPDPCFLRCPPLSLQQCVPDANLLGPRKRTSSQRRLGGSGLGSGWQRSLMQPLPGRVQMTQLDCSIPARGSIKVRTQVLIRDEAMISDL